MSYIPNFLTILRILLIPVFGYYFLTGSYFTAGIIFLISVCTDFFDGYFARKYNLTTKLGRLLDPLADKLTIISVLFILALSDVIPRIIAIILLTREIFILIGSALAYLIGVDVINPTRLGKLSIFLLYSAITAKLLNFNYIDMILFYIVIPLNIITGIDYFIKFIKHNNNNEIQ